MSQQGLVRGR